MSLISARQLDLTSHLGYASGSGRQLRIASTALGDGLTGGDASVLSVAVSDLVGDGIENDGSNNFRLKASVAGDGLAHSAGVLSVNAGAGLAISGDNVIIDLASTLSFSGGVWTFPVDALQVTGTPDSANDAVNKAYVDAQVSLSTLGLDFKNSCRAATTANITLSGAQTIDDVSIVSGDRVLVMNQTAGEENGIYVAAAGAWARATDADVSSEVTAGMYTFISEGTAKGNRSFVLTTDDAITLGTTPLVFTQFSAAGQISAGAGLGKAAGASGADDLFVNVDGSTIEISADALRVKADGITESHLNTSVAGAGLAGGGGVALSVNVANGIEISGDNVQLASTVAGDGLSYTAGVLAVNVASGLAISGDDVILASSSAGDGLSYTAGVLAVNVAGGLEISGDNVQIADGGIEAAKLGFTVKRISIPASSFVFSSPISTYTVTGTPDISDQLKEMQELYRNGVADGEKSTTGEPDAAGEWRLNGSVLEIYGDVTATGDTYKILYHV